MRPSTLLTFALSLALVQVLTAAPVAPSSNIRQLQQRHDTDKTADKTVSAADAGEGQTSPPPTTNPIIMPCPTKPWPPLLGHGPICSKAAPAPAPAVDARAVSQGSKPDAKNPKHDFLDYGLGP
ncbi:MAG: hypothetical protein J3R72DRAFT_430029 [Linnemannia gamsii]|nr:MAG: hypothetical protein J3R72DRAFT_430029 [Linnemannia gamsii]